MDETKRHERSKDTVFERHAKLTLLVVVLVLCGLIELASYFVIRVPGFYPEYNRKVSGYTVFQNNPKHQLVTQKSDPANPDVIVDENGFITGGPLSLEKASGTVRIFLMGGSAAFGADQNSHYRDLYEYPFGVYTYPDSIAGQLQSYLEARRPESTYEVITAAAFTRAYHQSVLFYLEAVSRFSPDWIISMDGYNDINHLVSGTPYLDRATELQYYIDLRNSADCKNAGVPSTYCLLQGLHGRLMIALTRGRTRALPEYAVNFDLDSYTVKQYAERKQSFEASSSRFVQTLKHEMGIMRADDVNFMFVLQPMLHRQGWNKALSERETIFARGVAPPLYSVEASSATTEPQEFIDTMLLLKFFFDDHLSPTLEKEVTDAGYTYLDMNRAIQNVPSSTEFYTDYCHMTVEGNRLIAEAIGEAIIDSP
jgi:hypothetical protein